MQFIERASMECVMLFWSFFCVCLTRCTCTLHTINLYLQWYTNDTPTNRERKNDIDDDAFKWIGFFTWKVAFILNIIFYLLDKEIRILFVIQIKWVWKFMWCILECIFFSINIYIWITRGKKVKINEETGNAQ